MSKIKNDSRVMRGQHRADPPAFRRRCLPLAIALLQYGLAAAETADTSSDTADGRSSLVPEAQAVRPAVRFSNQYFRSADGSPLDVSRFSRGNSFEPGRYPVELYVNGAWLTRRDLDIGVSAEGSAVLCLDKVTLAQAGLDIALLPEAARAASLLADGCADPVDIVPGARVGFDSGEMRVDLELPQAYLRRRPRGHVDPALWDKGVTSAMLSYDANVYRNWSQGFVSTHGYVGLDGGVNLAGWQLRHQGTFTSSDTNAGAASHQYAALNTYVRHDVTPLQARFIGGQYYTPGDMFDGFGFTGAQLSSDDRMLPDTLRSYAPVVRGVASSNAKVTVRQGTTVVYEASVPPGPFVIDDLYDTGYAGDLTVTVTEADGSSHSFLLPYASVPQLLRPGTHRFSATAGTLRDKSVSGNRAFVQGTYRRGVSNGLTLYGGVTAAEQYQTVLAGAAFSTPVGAIAADVSQSWAQDLPAISGRIAPQGAIQGQSYRLTYNKRVDTTDTNITLGAYRYSSHGYLTFLESEQLRGASQYVPMRTRHRFQLTVSQPLPHDLGSLYFNGYTASYWARPGTDVSYSAGYTQVFRLGTLNLNVQRSRTQMGRFDTLVMATVSVPLSRVPRTPVMQTRLSYGSDKQVAGQVSVSGTANDARTLSYNAYGEYRDTCCGGAGVPAAGNGGGSVNYMTSIGTVGGSISGGTGYSQVSATLSGGLVAHPGGLTLSQRIGDAVAVIEAPGAEGADVLSAQGIRVDGRGFAVQPNLAPYRMNDVGLDVTGARDDVDVIGGSVPVVPRSGAVVMVRFKTEQGQPLMFRALRANGMPVQLGADVLDAEGTRIATVGQGGLIYLRSEPGERTFTVRWSTAEDGRCTFQHNVAAEASSEDGAPLAPAVRVDCK